MFSSMKRSLYGSHMGVTSDQYFLLVLVKLLKSLLLLSTLETWKSFTLNTYASLYNFN